MTTFIVAAARIAALGVIMLLSAPGVARADALDDCRRARPADRRLAACSEVIKSPASSPEDKALAYRLRGSARLDAGSLDLAHGDLTEAIGLAPGDANARMLRGQARVGRNDIDGAIADFTEALRIAPGSAAAFTGRGHAHTVRGSVDLAIADFTEAIVLSPKNAMAYNNRGLAYRRAGLIDLAIVDYTSAITQNPIYALAYNNRGYAREARGEREAAVADFREALLLDPSLVGAKEGLERLHAVGLMVQESAKLVGEGKALVETHCSRCHAVGPDGTSLNPKSPPFRTLQSRHPVVALREPLTRGIAAPHDEMPRFALQDSEIDKIVAYINSLAGKR